MNSEKQYHWFLFTGKEILLRLNDEKYSIPFGSECPVSLVPSLNHISTKLGEDCFTGALPPDAPIPDGYETVWLRKAFELLPFDSYVSAGRCSEILYWDKNSMFCSACGGKMHKTSDISKKCEKCSREVWPQLSTAIIVLVRRGDEVLLVKAKNFVSDFYGLIAGFVETGETLEECVHREVMEETGITIGNVRYFSSQPWPYPSGLMIGFVADYVSGSISLQRSELNAGQWFNRSALPTIPGKLSMARMLLDAWIENKI